MSTHDSVVVLVLLAAVWATVTGLAMIILRKPWGWTLFLASLCAWAIVIIGSA
jgi:hypothetical protein